jgi:hypothetical protein
MDPVHPQSNSNRAIEVVDCFDQTIVSVTQVDSDPGRGRARAMLAASLVCLLLASASFFSALHTAASNDEAGRAHTAAGHPAHSFRPERVSPLVEWVGGAGFAFGLAFGLGYLLLRRKDRSGFLAEMPADEASAAANFEMIRVAGLEAAIRVHPKMRVSLTSAQGPANDNDLCAQGLARRDEEGYLLCSLPDDAQMSVQHGDRRYHLRWAKRSTRREVAPALGIDSRFTGYVAVTAALVLLLVATLGMISQESKALYTDSMTGSERYVAVRSVAMEDAIAPDLRGSDGNTDSPNAREAGAAGEAGIESATAKETSMKIKKRADSPSLSRRQVRAMASHAGMLGLFSDRQIFASFESNTSFASSESMQDWYGGPHGGPAGHQVGTPGGGWGDQEKGMAREGTSKVGDLSLGTKYGRGDCETGGPCEGATKMRRHDVQSPKFIPGVMRSSGGLDARIIRRHIKKKKLRIQHCYEKRLLAEPGLAGTTTSAFSITGNGAVIGSTANGMGDPVLEGCVARVIAGIQFPKTAGASVVNVRYPFTFQQAGG